MAKDFYIKAQTASSVTPSALTKTDDTNVTLTLGGTPSTALLESVSLTLGWTGTLADSRIASAAAWNAKGYMLAGNANGAKVGLGVTTYFGFGAGTSSTNETQRRTVVSAGTVSGVYLRTNASMTGSMVVTVMKNGSATSMTFTISAGSAAGLYSTTSNSFSVADGDEVSIRIAQSTATSAAFYGYSIMVK